MTTRLPLIAVALAAVVGLAACETDTSGAASSGGAATSSVTPGSSTGAPSGSDTNVQGAGSAGSAPATPSTR